jgi:IclR family transcriptional regulator, acetate operon repressor
MTSTGRTQPARSQTIATVERAVDVLMLFAVTRTSRAATLGVTEIANELGLSKAAVHRILSSLKGRGLLDLNEESRRYSLGPAVLNLGLAYLDRLDIRELAQPELERLCETTNETATLSTRSGDTRVYVSQVLPDREVKMTVPLGRPFPLHTGGSSKAFLAWLGESELDAYLREPLQSLTVATVVDVAQLRIELMTIRSRGYAVSFGERQAGAASVAAPVFDHLGAVTAVVSVAGPEDRLRESIDSAAIELLAATERLSVRLGHTKSIQAKSPNHTHT